MTDARADYPNRRPIEAYAQRYHLLLPERQKAAQAGDLAGRRTGSSIEYQDRKDYVPGDDVRHVDWRAFARNDRLTVKLYREEISPRVDLIVDTSLSMAVSPEKAQRRLDLTYLLYLLARKHHAVTRLFNLGRRLAPFQDPLDLLAAEDLRQDTPLPLLHGSPLVRQGGMKIVVSDFLFPFAPDELAGLFAAADRLVLVQVLTAFEDDPAEGGNIRLEDAESGDYLDVQLNRATIEGYKSRLNKLRGDLDRRLRTLGGAFVCVRDGDSLDEMMRRLLRGGVVGV